VEYPSDPFNIPRTRGISVGQKKYPSNPWNIPRTRGISLGPVEYPLDPVYNLQNRWHMHTEAEGVVIVAVSEYPNLRISQLTPSYKLGDLKKQTHSFSQL